MVSLLKVLRNDKTPPLRNYLTLPLQLNAEPDDNLLKITENRVPAFSHDFVPNLLRTKPDPELETKYHTLNTRMTTTNADTSQVRVHQSKRVTMVVTLLTYSQLEFCGNLSFYKFQKHINLHNKILRHIVEVVSSAKADWETETASRSCLPATSSLNESHSLLAALGTGQLSKLLQQLSIVAM